MAKNKTCFVIGPVGKPNTKTREWADKIFEYIITPAAKSCSYETPVRADKSSRPGMITAEILQHLFNDDMVIADLTEGNPNVYYELAIRHALPKPFVQLIKKGEKLRFDLKDLRTVEVGLDIKEATDAIKLLHDYIVEAEKRGDKVVTPITQVSRIEMLQRSGDTQKQILGELLAKINNIEAYVRNVDLSIAPSLWADPYLSGVYQAEEEKLLLEKAGITQAQAEELRRQIRQETTNELLRESAAIQAETEKLLRQIRQRAKKNKRHHPKQDDDLSGQKY